MRTCAVTLAACTVGLAMTRSGVAQGRVPLCPGLTIVTAISRPEGDYESIKTVTDADRSIRAWAYSCA